VLLVVDDRCPLARILDAVRADRPAVDPLPGLTDDLPDPLG
jgi:hypothetical protein